MDRSNYYYLFAGLMLLLGVDPFLAERALGGPLVQLAFSSVLVIGVFSLSETRWAFHCGVALAVVGPVLGVGYLATGWIPLRIANFAVITAFCLIALGALWRSTVFARGAVTLNRVVGALCIYMLLGVMWSVLFAFLELLDPTAFHYSGKAPDDPLVDFLYFSFVTLTTLGYGDITPVHPVARTLAYLEAVAGQFFLTVLVAGLVGRHIAEFRTEGSQPAAAK